MHKLKPVHTTFHERNKHQEFQDSNNLDGGVRFKQNQNNANNNANNDNNANGNNANNNNNANNDEALDSAEVSTPNGPDAQGASSEDTPQPNWMIKFEYDSLKND